MTGMRLCLTRGAAAAASVVLASAVFGQGGDTVATATAIASIPHSSTGTTIGYVNDYDEVCPWTGSTAPDVVYSYVPGEDQNLDISLCTNSNYDTKVYVYENAVGTLVDCNDDDCSTPSFPYEYVSALYGVPVTAGNTYYIIIDGYSTAAGNYTLDVTLGTPPPPPPTCPPDTMSGQPATPGSGEWTGANSDEDGGYRCADTYTVSGEIGAISFWGLAMFHDGVAWSECSENPRDFLIEFLPDAGGAPNFASPACSYTVLGVTGVPAENYGGFTVFYYEVTLPFGCAQSAGWVSIYGINGPDCWFLWANSPVGDGVGYQYDNAAGSGAPTDYDLSYCLRGAVGAQMYLDGPGFDPWYQGEPPAYPVPAPPVPWVPGYPGDWHQLQPVPGYCTWYDTTGFEDVGVGNEGYVGVCDNIELQELDELGNPVGAPSWWHIDDITITILIELTGGGSQMYLDWMGELDPFPDFWTGIWEEAYPFPGVQHDAYWTQADPPAGLLGDFMTIGADIYIVIEVAIDIIVSQEAPTTGACCVDTVCVATTEYQECIDQGGDWFAGETCPEFDCPLPPQGACCVGEDCVATTTADECAGMGGVWYFGETCPEFQCPLALVCPEGSMLDQPPTDPSGAWAGVTSDLDAGYIVYDNYNVAEPIGQLRFWGLEVYHDGSAWIECFEDPMNFLIEFYPDDGTGKPDQNNPACTYSVGLVGVPTGAAYSIFPLYQFETELAPACDLLSGWAAIIGADGATCWFLWANTQNGDGTLYWQYTIDGGTWSQADVYEQGFCLQPGGGGNPADVNGDGCVDVLDLLAVIAAWGNLGGPEDVNGDGIVDVLDLLAVIAAWGAGCP